MLSSLVLFQHWKTAVEHLCHVQQSPQAAPNTLVVWIPTDVHGTSLQDLDLKDVDPEFLQTHITIVTPNHLPSVWKKFCNSKMKYPRNIRRWLAA
jgi:hypothetical protein